MTSQQTAQTPTSSLLHRHHGKPSAHRNNKTVLVKLSHHYLTDLFLSLKQ